MRTKDQAIQDRLRRIEQKLDGVLRLVESTDPRFEQGRSKDIDEAYRLASDLSHSDSDFLGPMQMKDLERIKDALRPYAAQPPLRNLGQPTNTAGNPW